MAKTLQTIIQQWDCEFDIPIQHFIQAKKAWFYCRDWLGQSPAEHGLCSWKINQHKTDVNSSVNILYSLLHFKGSLSTFPTFRVEEHFFGLQTSAGHVLCAKAIGLSGYDCMQNINWKWGSAGFLRNLTRKDQRIWKEPTARKSEIIRNMEPEKYSNNTKTTACDVTRLYNGEQT